MSDQSPIRWSKYQRNVSRIGRSASMESIELKPEGGWEQIEAFGSDSPFEEIKPFFKQNYNVEGAEAAARQLKRSPMPGGDVSYVEITKNDEWQSRTEENGTKQKGCLQSKGYLTATAYEIGVRTFDTYTPAFLRRAAPVISAPVAQSVPHKTISSRIPNKSGSTLQQGKLENTKMEKYNTDALPKAMTKMETRDQQTRRKEEQRQRDAAADFKPVNALAGPKPYRFQREREVEE